MEDENGRQTHLANSKPWTIKGIPTDVRNQATQMAQARGETVGSLIARAIMAMVAAEGSAAGHVVICTPSAQSVLAHRAAKGTPPAKTIEITFRFDDP